MNCINCGAEIEDEANFCTNCGADLSQRVAQSKPELMQMPTALMQATNASGGTVAVQENNTQRKVAVVCFIIALLVLVAVGGLFLWKLLTPKELVLDADTIKDEPLRNTLTEQYDKNGDGKLSEDELGEVQTLELDSGNDYSYINLFWNLRTVNVKNSEVTSLDLSKNNNLKQADFTEAPNVVDIKLPNMPSYDNVKLPDNDDVNVTFPDNSEYEVKYVPSKVEEKSFGTAQEAVTTSTYEQSIESATVVNSISHKSSNSLFKTANPTIQTIQISYSDDGKIESTKKTPGEEYDGSSEYNFEYNDKNQIIASDSKSSETTSSSSSSRDEVVYGSDGKISTMCQDCVVEYWDNKIQFQPTLSNSDTVYNLWEFDQGHVVKFIEPALSNGLIYAKHEYEWSGDNLIKEKLTILNGYISGGMQTKTPSFDEMKTLSTDYIQYSYENSLLKTATFDSGFVQNFEYDAKGNLVRTSSSGKPNSEYLTFATDCNIEYAKVITKKDTVSLSFISLPGLDKSNLVRFSAQTREIKIGFWLTSDPGFQWPFTQDFTGKFWWDEENIINNQVEAAKARNEAESQK